MLAGEGILPIGVYSGQFAGFHLIVALAGTESTDQDNQCPVVAFH
jgi:hypothetical protein